MWARTRYGPENQKRFLRDRRRATTSAAQFMALGINPTPYDTRKARKLRESHIRHFLLFTRPRHYFHLEARFPPSSSSQKSDNQFTSLRMLTRTMFAWENGLLKNLVPHGYATVHIGVAVVTLGDCSAQDKIDSYQFAVPCRCACHELGRLRECFL